MSNKLVSTVENKTSFNINCKAEELPDALRELADSIEEKGVNYFLSIDYKHTSLMGKQIVNIVLMGMKNE